MPRGADTKQRITDGALKLFAERGVEATAMRDIAAAASITEPAVYRHFKSKDDLVWQIFWSGYRSLGENLQRAQAAEPRLRPRLAAMIAAICRLFDEDTPRFRFLLLTQHGQLGKITEREKGPVQVLHDQLAAAIATGELPQQDSELATSAVFGIVLQAATFKVYGRLKKPLTAYAPQLAAACWAALHPQPIEA
ncbi:MAG TPA: TetR family transcriptional regulator [Candidatus Binatia bacterium]|nr:TetR family transcriptional regulator [Candidatus Binatia bacterium]